MPTVETIKGPVEVDDLGSTLMHEHVFVLSTEHVQNYGDGSWWHEEARVSDAVAKLNALPAKGITTIVDPTVWGLGRYIPRIQRIAQQVDLNIIVATGLYAFEELPHQYAYRGPGLMLDTPEPMVTDFTRDIVDGIGTTGVKAAFLKCCVEAYGLTPGVERIARAVARTHVETGAPITVHTSGPAQSGRLAVDLFHKEGVDLTKVVIGHAGDSNDLDYLMKLADTGAILGMDRFGLDVFNPTADRVRTITSLAARGYADRMVLAHDASCFIDYFGPSCRIRGRVGLINCCVLVGSVVDLVVFSVGRCWTGRRVSAGGRGSPQAIERSEAGLLPAGEVRGTTGGGRAGRPPALRGRAGSARAEPSLGLWVVQATDARPGSGGHRPPRASMARPMRACGSWNPNAMRVIRRSLVFTDSTSALDSRCSTPTSMACRCVVTRAARSTKAGMRQRRAQHSHRSRARMANRRKPARARVNTHRRPSFSAQARCSRGWVRAIQSSLACCASVRSSGLRHNAQRAFFRALDASVARPLPPRVVFHTSRRTWSSASLAQATTWKGSMPRTAAGQRAATTCAIQSAPSADTWVICAQPSAPSRSKNRFRVALSRPGHAHTRRAVSWSTTQVMYRCPRL